MYDDVLMIKVLKEVLEKFLKFGIFVSKLFQFHMKSSQNLELILREAYFLFIHQGHINKLAENHWIPLFFYYFI